MKTYLVHSYDRVCRIKDRILHRNGCPIVVLMYHRVLNHNKNNSPYTVTEKNFAEQIAYIRKNFDLIKLDDDWSKVTSPSCVITFDDGYLDNYYIAKKYAVPMTLFISTACVGSSELFWWDELQVNAAVIEAKTKRSIAEITKMLINSNKKEQLMFLSSIRPSYSNTNNQTPEYQTIDQQKLAELAKLEHVTIGSHTVNHLKLTCLNHDDRVYELQASKKHLESIINKEVTTCSFPYGYHNRAVTEVAAQAGYTKAVTTQPRIAYKSSHLMKIPRVQVDDVGAERFKLTIRPFL